MPKSAIKMIDGDRSVSIYRTVYPVPSEAFIPSQIMALEKYKPTVWIRDSYTCVAGKSDYGEVSIVKLVKPGSRLGKLAFTMAGVTSGILKIPNIIHAHFGPDACMVLPVAKFHSIPLVVTFHGFDVQRSKWSMLRSMKPSNWMYLLRERELYRYAARVIAVSSFLRDRLISRGCPREKIVVRYIGVDTIRFCDLGLQRKKNRLINISRHVDWKGVDTILRALPPLLQTYPDIELIQIGSGPETENLKKLANNLGVASRVHWLGAVSHGQVLTELNKAELYVHASRHDEAGQTEAFGIALLEAQATGLPVVATNSGGIPEAMENGITGLLFEENDYQGLASAVHSLLGSRERLSRMALKARQFVVNSFDIKIQTSLLEKVYDEIVNQKAV